MTLGEHEDQPVFGETEYAHSGSFGRIDSPKCCVSTTCSGMYKYTDCEVEIDGKYNYKKFDRIMLLNLF